MVPTDIGAHIIERIGNVPLASSGGAARNGTGIDRQGFHSAVLVCSSGAVTGAPTSFTFAAKVQDSDDNSVFADYKDDGTNVTAIANITAANSIARKRFSLMRARRYVRVVETVTFVGGTTPTLAVQETVTLGGASEQPPA
jgi:hypothetical protein